MDLQQRVKALETLERKTWEEAKGFLAEREGRPLDADEETQWKRYNEDIDKCQTQARELVDFEKREAENAAIYETEREVLGDKTVASRARQDADLVRSFLRGETRLDDTDFDGKQVNALRVNVEAARRERLLIRQGATPDEVRALAWDTGNVASAVPTTMARTLYEVLEANIAAFRLPTTRINTESGEPMDFPKVTAHAIATQVAGQGTTLAGTDPQFSKLTLTPTKYGELVRESSEVVSDNGVNLEEFIGRDIARAVGRVIDVAQIALMIPATGLGSVNTGGSAIGPIFEKLIDVLYAVNDAYRGGGNAAWLWRDATLASIRKLRDGAGGTEGTPLWQPAMAGGLLAGQQPTLLDYPVFTDPNVASMASNARIGAFGDWNGYFLRTVGDVLVERNDSVGFATDEVYFRGKWRVAGGYQDTGSVVLLKQNV